MTILIDGALAAHEQGTRAEQDCYTPRRAGGPDRQDPAPLMTGQAPGRQSSVAMDRRGR